MQGANSQMGVGRRCARRRPWRRREIGAAKSGPWAEPWAAAADRAGTICAQARWGVGSLAASTPRYPTGTCARCRGRRCGGRTPGLGRRDKTEHAHSARTHTGRIGWRYPTGVCAAVPQTSALRTSPGAMRRRAASSARTWTELRRLAPPLLLPPLRPRPLHRPSTRRRGSVHPLAAVLGGGVGSLGWGKGRPARFPGSGRGRVLATIRAGRSIRRALRAADEQSATGIIPCQESGSRVLVCLLAPS